MIFLKPFMLLCALSSLFLAGASVLLYRAKIQVLSRLYDSFFITNLSLRYRAFFQIAALGMASVAIAFALAKPVLITQSRNENNSQNSIAQQRTVYVMLDVSSSMYVRDANGKTRMQRSVEFLKAYAHANPSCAYQLIAFTDKPALIMPSTDNQIFFFAVLDEFASALKGYGTSDFSSAVQRLLKSRHMFFSDAQDGNVILFVSDGESHTPTPPSLLKDFLHSGYFVTTVSVGSAEGGLVPGGNEQTISQSQPFVLKRIAERSNGNFISLSEASLQTAALFAVPPRQALKSIEWLGYFTAFLFMCIFAAFVKL